MPDQDVDENSAQEPNQPSAPPPIEITLPGYEGVAYSAESKYNICVWLQAIDLMYASKLFARYENSKNRMFNINQEIVRWACFKHVFNV